MNGFHNRVLHVDLKQRSFAEESIDDAVYQQLGPVVGKSGSTFTMKGTS